MTFQNSIDPAADSRWVRPLVIDNSPADREGEQLLRRLAVLPIRMRRRLLRGWFVAGCTFGRFKPSLREVTRVATVLHMPLRAAYRVVRLSYFHDLLFAMEWCALASRPLPGLLRDADYVVSSDPETIELAAGLPVVIVALPHMGPYSASIAWLAERYFRGREIILVRSKQATPEEHQSLERLDALGVTLRIFFIDRQDEFIELLRAVRRGAVLITLVDLPQQYGRSVEADILWRPGRLAMGVSDLAALCRAPILLLRTRCDGVRDTILVEGMIDVAACDAVSRNHTAGLIARFLSRAVIASPAQWHLWDRLEEFYAPADARA